MLLIVLDLFSGMDVFFFNFSVFQGFFLLFSFLWLLYMNMFSLFSLKKIIFYFYMNLFFLFLGGLDDMKGFSLKGWFSMLWGFFIFMTLGNMWGLFPYIYGVTTKVYVVLFLALWGWGSVMFSSVFTKFFLFFGHFCPSGSPLILGWFLSLVEVVSVGIRPGTLTLRLVAKMTTGHILMGLITLSSCSLIIYGDFIFIFLLLLLQGYLIFEFFICMIQGNVFFMLLANYTSEHL